jgi:riboflavin synthase
MFTGIIEALGRVVSATSEGSGKRFRLECPFTHELQIDQSLAHDGACLTVVGLEGNTYEVVAIEETLQRTTLGQLAPGASVNLERSLRVGARLDGHFVQGHVDARAAIRSFENRDGSWWLVVELAPESAALVVPKGSICLSGISLTVAAIGADWLAAAIIPYTYAHTMLHERKAGDLLNIEYDIFGKYVLRAAQTRAVDVAGVTFADASH